MKTAREERMCRLSRVRALIGIAREAIEDANRSLPGLMAGDNDGIREDIRSAHKQLRQALECLDVASLKTHRIDPG